jgi:hypothetical protein
MFAPLRIEGVQLDDRRFALKARRDRADLVDLERESVIAQRLLERRIFEIANLQRFNQR